MWLAHLRLPHIFPTIEDVLRDIRDMGGMTSWAHPNSKMQKWLPYFQECGLQGIEVYRLANKKYHAKSNCWPWQSHRIFLSQEVLILMEIDHWETFLLLCQLPTLDGFLWFVGKIEKAFQ